MPCTRGAGGATMRRADPRAQAVPPAPTGDTAASDRLE
ncbi:MAG: hypothetical protein AVDCRST_MAG88-4733 [uncultured Thermomicrobiales bacterium]|uniref:Uncharacterized protein n=1 Tax=uncultured Thermomicrobiales bacterium TaxID=1645740 RepID=A0A6J4VYH2_9BACT|nr:MAG: hypothetical protein AVDCRST_MAG88-4733 [uncultured Thermomicrobiales bacterium]